MKLPAQNISDWLTAGSRHNKHIQVAHLKSIPKNKRRLEINVGYTYDMIELVEHIKSVFQAAQSPILPFTFQYNRTQWRHPYIGEYLLKNEEVSNKRSGEILLITADPSHRSQNPILTIERFGTSNIQ